MTRRPPLAERQARYDRLKERTAGPNGMTLDQAGALETPQLARATVSAILTRPRPAPMGRPAENDDRESVQARIRYWQGQAEDAPSEARRREAQAQVDALTAQLVAVPA